MAMTTFAKSTTSPWRIVVWLLPLLLVALQPRACECRYLPTRSHGDDLDKLRELMLHILESSNEEQHAPNDVSGNIMGNGNGNGNSNSGNSLAQRASWFNKAGLFDAIDEQGLRKYGSHGVVDRQRYF